MRRVNNDELKRRMLTALADRWKILEIREPNHLSSYVGCRTRTFLDHKGAISPTDQEVMLFALGYGLQDVLTPPDSKEITHTKEGIIYRPDMTLPWQFGEQLLEMKTTRKSAKNHYIDSFIPLTWLMYMKGGCYIADKTQYDLVVLYMMGNYAPPFPEIYADTFIFEPYEIEENWAEIMQRKAVLDRAIESNEPPTPFRHCYDWECGYCRYKMTCEAMCMALGIPGKDQMEDQDRWQ